MMSVCSSGESFLSRLRHCSKPTQSSTAKAFPRMSTPSTMHMTFFSGSALAPASSASERREKACGDALGSISSLGDMIGFAIVPAPSPSSPSSSVKSSASGPAFSWNAGRSSTSGGRSGASMFCSTPSLRLHPSRPSSCSQMRRMSVTPLMPLLRSERQLLKNSTARGFSSRSARKLSTCARCSGAQTSSSSSSMSMPSDSRNRDSERRFPTMQLQRLSSVRMSSAGGRMGAAVGSSVVLVDCDALSWDCSDVVDALCVIVAFAPPAWPRLSTKSCSTWIMVGMPPSLRSVSWFREWSLQSQPRMVTASERSSGADPPSAKRCSMMATPPISPSSACSAPLATTAMSTMSARRRRFSSSTASGVLRLVLPRHCESLSMKRSVTT
mmetsp:Transcript_23373/g.73287  ORF Transcript_23373/g.73287 Transcript_23373/m.73287 type:complete len:384 (+) Transcript_23373:176-1327(+)